MFAKKLHVILYLPHDITCTIIQTQGVQSSTASMTNDRADERKTAALNIHSLVPESLYMHASFDISLTYILMNIYGYYFL